ncbi:MAG: acetyl-CoA carboxylase carboxyl transferase subunit alpha [Candidatus Binatota bacterium]|jgi:acetyl-CoA carboxylase carboxyl transferase subunit alpha|nr:acetyl-CoA carboxylase carboxyl transferase subunit alpha [Candidatus Binatota bacterium]
MLSTYLEFERPLEDVDRRIEALRGRESANGEVGALEVRRSELESELYTELAAWQRVQLSRHPDRPQTLDVAATVFQGFLELHGDRSFSDDPAIVGGCAWLDGQAVLIVGHQRGRTTQEKLRRNFGMPKPEGYRKALRLFRLAERFGRPVVCLIDTQGAFPGPDAEERGQAEAIARNLRAMAALEVPIVVAVIGEGGSGGALALGVGDRLLMLENACYSVITPEGCASILYREKTAVSVARAAEALKLTARDLLDLRVIDEIVPEPAGGAHRHPVDAMVLLGGAIARHLRELRGVPVPELLQSRYEKLRRMGAEAE